MTEENNCSSSRSRSKKERKKKREVNTEDALEQLSELGDSRTAFMGAGLGLGRLGRLGRLARLERLGLCGEGKKRGRLRPSRSTVYARLFLTVDSLYKVSLRSTCFKHPNDCAINTHQQ